MRFDSPALLAALAVVPAIIGLYVRTRRRQMARRRELAAQGLAPVSPLAMRKRRHVPFALFTLALALLVVALAKPQANLTLPRREGTVILAFDVSNSMSATDLAPARIEAARVAARAFVERQPSTIRIGVVAFGDAAVAVQNPTTVRTDVVAAIDRLSLQGGTSLAQGIFASLSAISGKPIVVDPEALARDSGEVDIGYFGSASIVILSDGENTARPDPISLAELASAAGVRIHAIGVGTEAGTVVEVDGFNIATALDRESLERVAEVTDGAYYQADTAAGLTEIYKSIDLEYKSVTKRTEVSGLFAAAGGLLLTIGALLSLAWFGRVI